MAEDTLEVWLDKHDLPNGFEDRKRLWSMFEPSSDYWGSGQKSEHNNQDGKLLEAFKADERSPQIAIETRRVDAGGQLSVKVSAKGSSPVTTVTVVGGTESIQKSEETNKPFDLGAVNEPGFCSVRVISGAGAAETMRDAMAIISRAPDDETKFDIDLITAPRSNKSPGSEQLTQEVDPDQWDQWQDAAETFFRVLQENPDLLLDAAREIFLAWSAKNSVSLSNTATVCAIAFFPVAMKQKINCLLLGAGNAANFFANVMKNLLNKEIFGLGLDEKKLLEASFDVVDAGVGAVVGLVTTSSAGSSINRFCRIAGAALPVAQSVSVNAAQKHKKSGDNYHIAVSLLFQEGGKILNWVCISRDRNVSFPR